MYRVKNEMGTCSIFARRLFTREMGKWVALATHTGTKMKQIELINH